MERRKMLLIAAAMLACVAAYANAQSTTTTRTMWGVSCSDYKGRYKQTKDGVYQIFIQDDVAFSVYCYGMASSSPKMYLQLTPSATKNFATYFKTIGRKTSCAPTVPAKTWGQYGTTYYTSIPITAYNKIITVNNLQVNATILDYDTTVTPYNARTVGKFVKYGTAGDQYYAQFSTTCLKGAFSMDLSGTPFAIDPMTTWSWSGKMLTSSTTKNTPQLTLSASVAGGASQTISGKCGGFPGTCMPSVDGGKSYGIRFRMNSPCQPVDGSLHPCSNGGTCIAQTDTAFKCECPVGWTGLRCTTPEADKSVLGTASAARDDAISSITCPAGSIIKSCACDVRDCDGAYVNNQNTRCYGRASYKRVRTRASATCARWDPSYVHVQITRVPGSGYAARYPGYKCPGSTIYGCTTYTPWFGKGLYGRGTVNKATNTCNRDCRNLRSPKACTIGATCVSPLCNCKNGGTCNLYTGVCTCPKGYVGTNCETFDYCRWELQQTRKAPCLNGGVCAAKPNIVVNTFGGDGTGRDCIFPFNWKGKQFSNCINDNANGPPFACGVMFDGHNDYVNLGGYHPGYVFSYEVWFRPDIIQKWRETVIGNMDSCLDSAITISNGNIGMAFKPSSGCTTQYISTIPVSTSHWHHAVMTMDGSYATLYVNGTQVTKQRVKAKYQPSGRAMWLGNEVWCNANCNQFEGAIKLARVYQQVLSITSIRNNALNRPFVIKDAVNKEGMLAYHEFGSDAPTAGTCSGTEHNGKDWVITKKGTVVTGVHCNVRDFIIKAGVNVIVKWWQKDGKTNGRNNYGGQYGNFEVYAKNVYVYGSLSAWGAGLSGGPRPTKVRQNGYQGFSTAGLGGTGSGAKNGGGGAGGGDPRSRSFGKGGGGGGYGTKGSNGFSRYRVGGIGQGGNTYGDKELTTLFLGSGGGSGGNDNALHDNPQGGYGGRGGGAIRLDAREKLVVTGSVNAQGQPGQGDSQSKCVACPSRGNGKTQCSGGCGGNQTTACWDWSGPGGGGSGGSIYLRGETVSVGSWKVNANGGRGGYGPKQCGGNGGAGRVRIDYAFLAGTTAPASYNVPHNESFVNLAPQSGRQIYVYRGCYQDSGTRLLPYKANGSPTSAAGAAMKPSTCINLCKAKGYVYAGIQYRFECFCGNNIDAYPKRGEGECQTSCQGDSDQRCGGTWRMSVYGPMPTGSAKVGNGAKQECKPWCRVGWLAKTSSTAGRPLYGYCSGLQTITSFNTQCDCPAGRTGPKCENDCPPNKFGKGCTQTCQCKNKGTCDPATGACSCAPGWRGTTCSSSCARGWFGPNCASKCSCNLLCTPTSNCDSNHSTSFEAESGTLGHFKPAIVQSDPKASGRKYLLVTANNQWTATAALLISNYTFKSQVAQQYRLWLRVLSPNTASDSVYYSIDGGTRRTCWVGQVKSYGWRRCNTVFNLKVGSHILGIFNREKGLGIDKVFVGTDHAASNCNAKTGTCTCNPGYLGPTCSNVCPFNKFGTKCSSTCACKNDGICSPLDGHCTCLAGFAGSICDQKCGTGLLVNRYGPNCAAACTCQNLAPCDAATGKCSCQAGYKGVSCELPCSAGQYGPGCTLKCNCKNNGVCDTRTGVCQCPAGYGGSDCGTACTPFTYGVNCAQKCNLCPTGTTQGCNSITGACICNAGVNGLYCNQTCPTNKFGQGCSQTCCCNKNRATCDVKTGACACKNGWQGTCCNTACKGNRYGPNCASTCACQNGGVCNRFNGACTCKAGYTGTDCGTPCNTVTPYGKYGLQCRLTVACTLANTASYDSVTGVCTCKAGFGGLTCQPCPTGTHGAGCLGSCGCVNGGQCHAAHGTCDCPAGFHGATCDTACGAGTYGYKCALTCGCKNGAACNAVSGACTCSAGYTGPACDTTCPVGSYGLNCALTCPSCIFGNCNPVTGTCDCSDGYTGTDCRTPCTIGFWGKACTQFCSCPVGASCNNTNGACSCTLPGQTGAKCDQGCPGGKYGVGCVSHCPACSNNSLGGCDGATGACVCKDGYTGPLCQQSCPVGTWGNNCSKTCLCANGVCHPDLGYCVCNPGYTGLTCQAACTTGKYGQGCAKDCLCSPPRGNCNGVDGSCTCLAGFIGVHCENTCPTNHWGPGCANTCVGCDVRNGVCDHVTGVCHCIPGKMGVGCSQTCSNGTWGVNCNETCQCLHGNCDPTLGTCTCFDGYMGPTCRDDCPTGFWGPNCLQTCNCQNNATCNHLDGTCDCTPGFVGSACNTPCGPNNFGHNCYQTCSCQNGATCDTVTGFCSCPPGWNGLSCELACPAGTWGPHCVNTCPYCEHQTAGTCNVTSGLCQCDPGFKQPVCNETCDAGFFGAGCLGVCSCSGPGSICIPQNGTCLCGGAHEFCKWGTCDQNGHCQCSPGFNGTDCTTPCLPGYYGQGCIQKCACAATASCNNIDGTCICPGPVVIAGTQMDCNGQGTCATVGVCTCNAGFTGADCSQACPTGKWGAGCTQTCRQCNLNEVCSPFDGTCVDHCVTDSGDRCQHGGVCLPTGGCNCSTTGYGGAHCDVGVLNLQVQSLSIYKTASGANVEATWILPANLANFSVYEPVVFLQLTDLTAENVLRVWTEKINTVSFLVPTTPNHYYTFSVSIKTAAGGGMPVTARFSANLLCLQADSSVNCRYTNCNGRCNTTQFCNSLNSQCISRCHLENNCVQGNCNEANGHCTCSSGYGGVHCDTAIPGTNGNAVGQTDDSGTSAVSTGSIVGIVLGGVALVALIAVLIGVLYIRQQTKQQPTAGGSIDVTSGSVQYDASGDSVGFSNPVYAAPAQAPVKDNPLYASQEVLEDQ